MLPSEQMARQDPDKKLFVSADTNIPLHKQFIFATAADGGGAVTLTMPNVGEAKHRKFFISASSVGGTTGDQITIDFTDGGESSQTTSIATTGVEVGFESIGLEWIVTR